jgi:hypothetical protein
MSATVRFSTQELVPQRIYTRDSAPRTRDAARVLADFARAVRTRDKRLLAEVLPKITELGNVFSGYADRPEKVWGADDVSTSATPESINAANEKFWKGTSAESEPPGAGPDDRPAERMRSKDRSMATVIDSMNEANRKFWGDVESAQHTLVSAKPWGGRR